MGSKSFFHKTCLKSQNSLRTQLLLSFGTSSFVFLAVVVILACTSAFIAGRTVKQQADALMKRQVTDNLLSGTYTTISCADALECLQFVCCLLPRPSSSISLNCCIRLVSLILLCIGASGAVYNTAVYFVCAASRLVGEQFEAYTVDMEGTIQLMVEAVRDRIVGYPYEGWDNDAYVPFFEDVEQRQEEEGVITTETNNTNTSDGQRRRRRVYPLRHPPPPMEWNIIPNLNPRNAREHLQEREPWLSLFPAVSTATAGYLMQGACDPSVVDSDDPVNRGRYYPNCTDANNDIGTGGVVQPTPTNMGLYERSGELTVFLKALWESQRDALSLGVYFVNSGAGSQVVFPGYVWPSGDPAVQFPPYMSHGCDWMRKINPYTGVPFGTDEYIARCHPAGTMVPQREFNAMERPWCAKFASEPEIVGYYGPYRALDHGIALMTVGKAVFDRRYVI